MESYKGAEWYYDTDITQPDKTKNYCVITSSFDGVFIIPFFKEGRYVE